MFSLSGIAIPLEVVLLSGHVWSGRVGMAQAFLAFFLSILLSVLAKWFGSCNL